MDAASKNREERQQRQSSKSDWPPQQAMPVQCDVKRFKVETVTQIIQTSLSEELKGKTYDAEKMDLWSNNIAITVKQRLLQVLGFEQSRYKLVIQVVIGESKGEHVRICSQCMWDQQRDHLATADFVNDTIFCMAVVFGCFIY